MSSLARAIYRQASFWVLIAAGVQTATTGSGWHPDAFAALLGVAEVGFRARHKVKVRRHTARLRWSTNRRR